MYEKEIDTRAIIINRLRELQLTQTEAALCLGISPSYLTKIISGAKPLTINVVEKFESKLGLSFLQPVDSKVVTVHEKYIQSKKSNPIVELLSVHISEFARRKSVRDRFPVFIRRLVKSSVSSNYLTFVDFHANDESERHGIDGCVENQGFPNKYVPQGVSYWEIGTGNKANIKAKAESDFEKRTNIAENNSLRDKTFIFVTPYSWAGMDKWVNEKNKLKIWKEVRVYDVNTLEQWLEESPEAQIWLAQELGRQLEGIQTLENFWQQWIRNTRPQLPLEIFRPAYEKNLSKITDFFKAEQKVLTISADSSSEAKAFLYACCLFCSDESIRQELENTIIFSSSCNLSQIESKGCLFTAIYQEHESNFFENETFKRRIVIKPFGAIHSDIVLEHLSPNKFFDALLKSGFSYEDIVNLDNKTGRSITILRRYLLKEITLSQPLWVGCSNLFVPILLAGGFETANKWDMDFIKKLADGIEDDEIEEVLNKLISIDDNPIWIINKQQWDGSKKIYITNRIVGVNSIHESWFVMADKITERQLGRFYDLAIEVLAEPDPKWKYKREERIYWCSFENKYSEFLRENILSTLVFLSKYSEALFGDRISLCKTYSENLLNRVLIADDSLIGRLEDPEIFKLAQIAPNSFLSFLENEYRKNQLQGIFKELLRKSENNSLAMRSTSFLSALEAISWQDIYVERVLRLLFNLSEKPIKDNIFPTPESSFQVILNSLLFRESYSWEKLKTLLEELYEKNSQLLQKVLRSILDERTHDMPYAPLWDNLDAAVKYREDINEIVAYFVKTIIQVSSATTATEITEFLISFKRLNPIDQLAWLKNLQNWSKHADDRSRQKVLNQLICTFNAELKYSKTKYSKEVQREISNTKKSLVSQSQLWKNLWLFSSAYPHLSNRENLNFAEQTLLLNKLRFKAFRKIYSQLGESGIWDLINLTEVPQLVGKYAFFILRSLPKQREAFIHTALKQTSSLTEAKVVRLLSGFFSKYENAEIKKVAEDFLNQGSSIDLILVLKALPFTGSTWQIVDQLDITLQQRYWREVPLDLDNYPDRDSAIPNLIEAERYEDCYSSFDKRKISNFLYPILVGLALSKPKYKAAFIWQCKEDVINLIQSGSIGEREALTLENLYLDILIDPFGSNTGEEVPHLIKFLREDAAFFEQILDSETRKVAQYYLSLYRSKKFLEDAHINGGQFETWVRKVRESVKSENREMIDRSLGEIIAHTACNDDGSWPSSNVAKMIEDIGSTLLASSCRNEIVNMRGVYAVSDTGGEQERALVKKYMGWREKCRSQFVNDTIITPLIDMYEKQAKEEDANARLRRYM